MIDITDKLDELYDLAEMHWEKKEYSPIIDILKKMWNLLPIPKEKHDESFHIADYFANVYLELGNFDDAMIWANKIFECDLERADGGEREFLKGKVFFSQGLLNEAKILFEQANKKSEGRCFIDEDEKYKNLLTNKVSRPIDFQSLFSFAEQKISEENYEEALSFLYDCMNTDEGINCAKAHFRKGQCHFELEELDKSADEFTRAFMLEDEKTFVNEDTKYLTFLKSKIEINNI